GGLGDVKPPHLWDEMARRRVYVHPIRWTSLGFSLLEAMHLGMPVVALATTEVVEAVPAEAGVLSTRVETLAKGIGGGGERPGGGGVLSTRVEPLAKGIRRLVEHPGDARRSGRAGRAAVLARYGLDRFLA